MEDELVQRRKWLDHQHFLDLFAAINFIPGPSSTELAIALGRMRGGIRGLLLAGVCFIGPAVLIILPIAWLYETYHQLPRVGGIFRGASAAIVAIVAVAAIRFAQAAIKDKTGVAIAIIAAAAEMLNHRIHFAQADLLILGAAALLGAARSATQANAGKLETHLKSLAPWPLAALLGAISFSSAGPILMALIFLKIGATLFGSGYLLLTYLQDSFVDHHHWLTSQQVLDAVAVGQFTPGPLLTTATFIGFVLGYENFGGGVAGGVLCAILATAAIFAPAFLLIVLLGRWIEKLRNHPQARGALDAMNAAVVGLIAATCLWLGYQALLAPGSRWISGILILASLGVLLCTRINATLVVLAAAAVGFFG